MADNKITRHDIKLSLGGMRFDKDINVGWQVSPSIGIVAKDIDRMGLALTSYKEPLEQSVRDIMLPSIRKNFDKGGRPDKWPPLAEYTLKVKGMAGIANGDKPLIRTGALRRGASSFDIWDIGNTSATIRSLPDDIWYGAVHQQGSGSFLPFVAAATKQLGPRAGGLATIRRAFELLDQARGAGGHKATQIPQRRFIMFQEDDIDDIQDIFYLWMVKQTIVVGRFTK